MSEYCKNCKEMADRITELEGVLPEKGMPEWWPENPYPEPVRIMTQEEFAEAVPD